MVSNVGGVKHLQEERKVTKGKIKTEKEKKKQKQEILFPSSLRLPTLYFHNIQSVWEHPYTSSKI